MQIPIKLDRPFKNYSGFKCLVISFFFLVVAFPAFRLYSRHGLPPTVRDFLFEYWLSGFEAFAAGTVTILFLGGVLWSDALEHFYYSKFRRFRREPVRKLETLSLALAAASFLLVLYVVPFFNLYSPGWWKYLYQAAVPVLSALGYFAFFSRDIVRETIPRLSNFSFPKSYFDVASTAPFSKSLREEIAESVEYVLGGASSSATLAYMISGSGKSAWRGLEAFFQSLGTLLGVAPERISLHDRTTRAIEFALTECLENLQKDRAQPRPLTIVTTDSEYPDILRRLRAQIDEHPGCVIREAPVADMFWNRERQEQVTEAFLDFVSTHKPDILLLSHVAYWCGSSMDLEAITDAVRKMEPRPLVIVDGAQALGNVPVSPEALDHVDYYAACCHKWLLVPQTMGILVRNEKNLKLSHGFSKFRPLTRPFSAVKGLPDTLACSVNFESYFALNTLLQEEIFPTSLNKILDHNHRLCARFLEDLQPLGVRIVGSAPHGSIAAIAFGGLSEPLFRALEHQGIKCHLLKRRFGSSIDKVTRFGFHYFHSEFDVFRLINTIEEEFFRLKSRFAMGPAEE